MSSESVVDESQMSIEIDVVNTTLPNHLSLADPYMLCEMETDLVCQFGQFPLSMGTRLSCTVAKLNSNVYKTLSAENASRINPVALSVHVSERLSAALSCSDISNWLHFVSNVFKKTDVWYIVFTKESFESNPYVTDALASIRFVSLIDENSLFRVFYADNNTVREACSDVSVSHKPMVVRQATFRPTDCMSQSIDFESVLRNDLHLFVHLKHSEDDESFLKIPMRYIKWSFDAFCQSLSRVEEFVQVQISSKVAFESEMSEAKAQYLERRLRMFVNCIADCGTKNGLLLEGDFSSLCGIEMVMSSKNRILSLTK